MSARSLVDAAAALAKPGSTPYLLPMRRTGLFVCALSRAVALLTPALPGAAHAADASPWVKSAQSQARLIEGAGAGTERTAGLEIRLEPRFITYWRDPGDAGVPPVVSFAGSTNLGSATLRYPAPRRIEEAGAVAFGYEGDVTFPISILPADPSKPVGLAVSIDYAACHDICLPAHADLRLTLDGGASAEAARVRDAVAAVPRPSTVGGVGEPAITTVEPGADGGFRVTATGAGPGAALFVEAPEGWVYGAGPPVPAGAGRSVFPVKRLDVPRGADGDPAPLTLTLAAPGGAIEVPIRLDRAERKP